MESTINLFFQSYESNQNQFGYFKFFCKVNHFEMNCFTVLGLLKIQEYESNKLDLRAKPKLSRPMLIKLINIIILLFF